VYWDQGQGDGNYHYLDNTLGYLTYTVNAEQSSHFLPGLWYVFRVTAINAIGESVYSESIPILAAKVPDAPNAPTLVSQTPTDIVISWTAPYNGGSQIRDYDIYYDANTNGLTFTKLEPSAGGPSVTSYTVNSALHGI
jgi:hypothetical protein